MAKDLKTNVSQAISDFAAIKASIESRGVEVGEAPTSAYAAKIDAIPQGGGDDLAITDARYLFCAGARADIMEQILRRCQGVTTTRYMFNDFNLQIALDLSSLDTSQVTDMRNMFEDCYATSIDLSNFDTSQVTSMDGMFFGANKVTSLDVSSFNTSKVKNMSSMFRLCASLTSLDVSSFDTSQVTDMSSMFVDCKKLTSLDLSNFNTSKVTSMNNLFSGCHWLKSIDLSNFDTSQVTYMSSMFRDCHYLESIIGFSATKMAGVGITFSNGTSSSKRALKRLIFRTDLPEGTYAIRSAIDIKYCSFTNEGLAEMFATLPDVSGLGLSSSYTTITITGNPCVTDGSLTDDTRALATSRGWQLVE